MATHSDDFTPAVLLTEDELFALFDRGAGIDRLVERLIDILDAKDGDVALEDDDPAEPVGDDEESLGWSAAMSQLKLGANMEAGDKSAPERHKGFVRCGPDDFEPEAGYDLPEGDEEWDGEGEDREPLLGAPENHDKAPDQEHWAQGGYLGCTEAEIGDEES